MMMRAQTSIQTEVNRPLRERLDSLILGQSLAGGGRTRYCTSSFTPASWVYPPHRAHQRSSEFKNAARLCKKTRC